MSNPQSAHLNESCDELLARLALGGVSEIGVSFPDASFGPESYFAAGYPFVLLLRDALPYFLQALLGRFFLRFV